MAITVEDVEHVARLARLRLDDEEKETYRDQLSGILEHARAIGELDTAGVPPTSHALPVVNVFREDEVRPSLPVEEATGGAPDAEGGAFKVPRIV